ncbi:MAG: ABC transporter permease [Gammaproteobacteria bacterium]
MPHSTRVSASRWARPRGFLFTFGLSITLGVLFLAAFGELIAPYDPREATTAIGEPPPALLEWPSLAWQQLSGQLESPPHWFGTDFYGLDVFSRVISAPRTDVSIALGGGLFSLLLGTALGLIAGFFRNWLTGLLVRTSDVLQSFPVFITAMVLVALSGRHTGNIIFALCLVYTPIFLRLTRAEVMGQSRRGYVEAARAAGVPPWSIAIRHVLPNSLVPALIQLSVTIGFAIILTAGLSFVGAGVRPPTPEWGLMISQGAGDLNYGWWWPSVFPGLAISITVLGFASLGHVLEDQFR